MRQRSLLGNGFEKYRKQTRKEVFLNEIERIIPWKELTQVIEPFYPNPDGAGRKPKGLERMLRIYFMQHWFALSDPGAEEALYDSRVMREFAQIDLGEEPVPDETTILNFRHLLEKHALGGKLFDAVNDYLAENGLSVTQGTIVDATIIAAPSSTKNKDKKRDPDMHQTKQGNQWYFGMKAHIGVDSKNRLIHSVVATAANVYDSQILADLLHGEETRVYGDSAYRGQGEVIKKQAPQARDFTHYKARRNHPLTKSEKARNKTKSSIRARVEHVFHVIKQQFGFIKVRYKGLDKNANHLFACCALVNLVLMKKRLLRV